MVDDKEEELLQFMDVFGRMLEAKAWNTKHEQPHKYIVARPFIYAGKHLQTGDEFIPEGQPNDGAIINSGGRLVRWEGGE